MRNSFLTILTVYAIASACVSAPQPQPAHKAQTGPISAVKAFPVGDNWAQITWSTGQDADTVVEYGETAAYGSTAREGTLWTGHRITLFDLKPLTEYHFRVRSTNAAGQSFAGADGTFKTGAATIGAENNPTGEPLGGGLGYSRMVTRGQATAVVKSADELLKALRSAKPGDVIYIDDQAVIDLSDQMDLVIPGGVTIASGRGQGGSTGGLIRFTTFAAPMRTALLRTGGPGIRVTGVRLAGPSNAMGRTGAWYHCLYVSQYWTEIDNCEFWGWNYSAVETMANANGRGLYVHHNYFHHNTRLGCGYAICTSMGVALIEGNLFDFHRHSVASSAWWPSSYEARCNVVMEHSISHAFDMHGALDNEVGKNVAVWRFDEGRGTVTKDDSTYGHNDPKLHGFNEASWVAGKVKSALRFDGKSWVDATPGYRDSLGARAFCIFGWIKPDGIEGTQAIFSKAAGKQQGSGYSLRLAGPALEATLYDASGARQTKTAGVVAAGQWSHVGLSFDGSTARMYLNGREIASFPCSGVKQSAQSSLLLGRDSATPTSFFKGVIDEVRAYTDPMRPDDVHRNFIGQGDIAGVFMRIHHNTVRILDKGSVCVRGLPAEGCWINDNWFYRANDDWNIRQLNVKGNFFEKDNRFGPRPDKPAGHAPTLSFAGRKAFRKSGVAPLSGKAGDVYRFEVKYTDADGDAPLPGYPRLVLKRRGEIFLYETPMTMMPLDLGKFSKGRTYLCELTLPRGTDYTYAFEALDMAGNPAVGEATKDIAGPEIASGNTAPVLYPVMGHDHYVENWIYPSNGTVDTEFDFRVTYLDIDNDAPAGGAPRVRITDAGGADLPGSPFPMKPISATQDANGRDYQLLAKLPVGEFRCEIVAQDAQGGAPAANVRPTQIVVRPAGAATALTPRTPFE